MLEGLRLAQQGASDVTSDVPLELPIELASFHLVGKRDGHRSSSLRLGELYRAKGRITYEHAHGHELPMALLGDAELKYTLARFLNVHRQPQAAAQTRCKV